MEDNFNTVAQSVERGFVMAKIDLTRHSCDSYSTSRLQIYAQGRTIKRLSIFGVVDVGYGRKEMPFCVSILGVW